ncbi:MAG: hypothetical protein WC322_04985 [Candidatus Paceibacterota bacterium]|jgi:hypothetical protein
MTKETPVPADSPLYGAAEKLVDAARRYWELYQFTVHCGDAVVSVRDREGQMVIFTRGEYAEELREFIGQL